MRVMGCLCAGLLLLLSCSPGETGAEVPTGAVYYYDDGGLMPVYVELRPGEEVAALALAIVQPAPDGLSTDLTGDSIEDASRAEDVVTIDVGPRFLDGSDAEVEERAAQIVFALTGLEGVTSVRFEDGGSALAIAGDPGPLDRRDMRDHRPWIDVISPTPGATVTPRGLHIEVTLRREKEVEIELEASGQKYFDVLSSGTGVILVPRAIDLFGAGSITLSSVQGGRERAVTLPITFTP